ncbi:hypothetical protein [Dechloromonas sp. CZR5]|uniref:hypothetical protein n=1 Tax=Dechloromonas sp. CZR5 TaxID=2608630 RepID=UPI00123D86AD|nr:hypothetical protein [Dechloromonas sp. CZR5]
MRKPRQLNVQQQNARTLRSLRETAEYWRTHPVPEALLRASQQRTVDLSKAVVIDLEIDYPGIQGMFGVLLTQNERFIEFEIDNGDSEPEVYEWRDVTDSQNLGKHNRGIGVGAGALAIQVLHALNT